MTNKVNNAQTDEVMDARIVTLNNIKKTKASSVSVNKRPALKADKFVATYILDNWGNIEAMHSIHNDIDVTNADIKRIVADRLAELAAIEDNSENLPQEVTELSLTEKEQAALEFLVKADDGEGFLLTTVYDEASQIAGLSAKSVKGILSSLQKKGAITLNNGESYQDGTVTEAGRKAYEKLVEEVFSFEENIEEKAEKVKKEKKSDKKEAKQADKKKEKNNRKVGDVHKNGKWVWTEYAEGKFDWRTMPSQKQKTGAKSKDKKEVKQADKTEKAASKKVKSGKSKKNTETNSKLLTIEDFIALPTKTAKVNKKPSKAQSEALKLIMKGYKITSDKKFFEKEGARKACNMESVTALFARYGLDYIPSGLIAGESNED